MSYAYHTTQEKVTVAGLVIVTHFCLFLCLAAFGMLLESGSERLPEAVALLAAAGAFYVFRTGYEDKLHAERWRRVNEARREGGDQ